jgi:hypothetical protein
VVAVHGGPKLGQSAGMSESRFARVDVARVLEAGGALSAQEADAILEIAYLSTVVDGRLSDEEIAAFAQVAARLKAGSVGDGRQLDELLDGYARHIEHRDIAERLAELAKSLTRDDARKTAYKVAFAMALCDLGTSDDETDFDDALVTLLGLSIEDVDALESEVYAALDAVQ